jgi:hypothetical protein
MNGYAIVHFEADRAAEADNVLQHFNEYMQSRAHSRAPSFVSGGDGYFRLEYNDGVGASSAAIETFGTFLQQRGYVIYGISSARTYEGNEGTVMRFSHDGKEESVVLSTLNVY